MFEFLQIRGYFQKVVKSDGRVVIFERTRLKKTISDNHRTAKYSIFAGRVVKNRGTVEVPVIHPAGPAWPAGFRK